MLDSTPAGLLLTSDRCFRPRGRAVGVQGRWDWVCLTRQKCRHTGKSDIGLDGAAAVGWGRGRPCCEGSRRLRQLGRSDPSRMPYCTLALARCGELAGGCAHDVPLVVVARSSSGSSAHVARPEIFVRVSLVLVLVLMLALRVLYLQTKLTYLSPTRPAHIRVLAHVLALPPPIPSAVRACAHPPLVACPSRRPVLLMCRTT
jgi:hypothetical protein